MRRSFAIAVMVLLAAAPLALLCGTERAAHMDVPDANEASTVHAPDSHVATALALSADHLTENLGQVDDPSVRFVAVGRMATVALCDDRIEYMLVGGGTDGGVASVAIGFEGAARVVPVGLRALGFPTSYFLGNEPSRWVRGARSFEGAVYRGLWDGIDLELRIVCGDLKYDLIVAPGADPSLARFSFTGATGLKVERGTGDLLIKTPAGVLRDSAPWAYQPVEAAPSVDIPCDFALADDGSVGFDLGAYDSSRSLVIDPSLTFSTFIGGTDADWGYALDLDGNGNVYIAGRSLSTNFPVTSGAYCQTHQGTGDIIVCKLSVNGATLVYCTYIGTSKTEEAMDIAVDGSGAAYITGMTQQSTFPITAGAYDSTFSGDNEAIVVKLSASGTALEYSTFVGGSSSEEGEAIAIDSGGCAYVCGNTAGSFPTTSGAFDRTFNTRQDGFMFKLSADGSSLNYSTYIGGDWDDYIWDIALDSSGNAYATGYTGSTESTFPVTTGSFCTTKTTGDDGFLVKLNASGDKLHYGGYFHGDTTGCSGYGVVVDAKGRAYVAGIIKSKGLPTTAGAYDTSYNAYEDGFIAMIAIDGSQIGVLTYLGGSDLDERLTDIDLDPDGQVLVVGYSTGDDYPTTANAYSKSRSADRDVVVSKLDANLSSLLYSTYIGSTGIDEGNGIHAAGKNAVVVVGTTASSGFPNTTGAYDRTHNGARDVFAVKVPMGSEPPVIGPDRTPSTATTGDQFEFNVTVADADGVADVTVEHWRGASTSHTRVTMTRVLGDAMNGTYSFSMLMPPDSIADLSYTFSANDTGGDHNATANKKVTVRDDDKPTIEDLSAASATTGDTYTFKLRTTDNIGLNPLMVYVVFGFGQISDSQTMAPLDITGQGNGTYVFEIFVPQGSLKPIVYLYNVSDSSGNINMTEDATVPVTDNDAPAFGPDASDAAATTGDGFTFRVDMSDNINVVTHKVAYRFGAGPETNATMTGVGLTGTNGTYELAIAIPTDSLDSLHYRFWSSDLAGNLNSTSIMTRAVRDDDPPEYMQDISAKRSDTRFELLVEVNDNIGVSSVYALFRFGTATPSNLSMTPVATTGIGNGTYSLDVTIPTGNTELLYYVFAVIDTSGNWNVTPEVHVDVMDDKPPTFGADGTDSVVVKGQEMDFSIEVFDNLAMGPVHVEYWFGEGSRRNVTMTGPSGTGGTYNATVGVPRHPDGGIRYVFNARDLVGNWASSAVASRSPINQPPAFGELATWTLTEGEAGTYDLALLVSDPNDLVSSLVLSCADPRVTVEGFVLSALFPAFIPEQRVELSLSDGEDTVHANITIVVVNVNDAPVITSAPPLTGQVGVLYTYQVVWTDEDPGDTFTLDLVAKPAGMSVGSDGLVSWTPAADQVGPGAVDLTLSDGDATVHQTWTVTVSAPPTNRPPAFTSSPPLAATAGRHYQWNATAQDPDGDALTFSILDGPDAADMGAVTGALSWDPVAIWRGRTEDVNFTVQVSDGTNDVTLTFTVLLTYPPNHPPEISGAPLGVQIKDVRTVDLAQFKTDADDPKAALVWQLEGGDSDLFTAHINGDSLVIEPKKGAKGTSNLTLVLLDPWGGEDRFLLVVDVQKAGGDDGDGGLPCSVMWLLLLVLLVVAILVGYYLLRDRKGAKKEKAEETELEPAEGGPK